LNLGPRLRGFDQGLTEQGSLTSEGLCCTLNRPCPWKQWGAMQLWTSASYQRKAMFDLDPSLFQPLFGLVADAADKALSEGLLVYRTVGWIEPMPICMQGIRKQLVMH
jgi:hypothetical protein